MATKTKAGVDKWKLKNWYTVLAPEMFDGKEIAQILATDEATLLNRLIHVGLDDLTGDLSAAYTTLTLRIKEVKGKTAHTRFVGHELSRNYLRTLVRRNRDIVHEIDDITTKDGVPVRVKTAVVTGQKVSGRVKTAIRLAAHDEVVARTKEMDFGSFVQEVLFRKFSGRIYNRVKKLAPIKRVEIRKTEVQETFAPGQA